MSDTTQTLTIERIEFMSASVNMNPRVRATFTNGLVAQTETDSQVGYTIQNEELHHVPVLVTFTPAGRIRYVEIAK